MEFLPSHHRVIERRGHDFQIFSGEGVEEIRLGFDFCEYRFEIRHFPAIFSPVRFLLLTIGEKYNPAFRVVLK